MRDDLKRKEREIETLKMKLAQGGSGESAEATTTMGAVLVWTPPPLVDFDKKQHRQFVDDFKVKHRDRSYVAISTAVTAKGVPHRGLAGPRGEVRADQLLKAIAPVIEARGGGKAERAAGRFPRKYPGSAARRGRRFALKARCLRSAGCAV
jgi:alanyl-tRNA synthetase